MQPDDLDDLFSQVAQKRAAPSPDLLARVLSDAERLQPKSVGFAKSPSPGLWATLLAMVGGAPGLAGLSTAALAGVWLGFAQPQAVMDATSDLWTTSSLESVELLGGYDEFLAEDM